MVKVSRLSPRSQCSKEGRGGELAGGDAADGVGGAGGNQVDRELVGCGTVQFGELDAQQDLLLHRRLGNLEVVHHGFREGRRQRGRPVANVFIRYPSGEGKRIPRRLNMDVFCGEGFLQQLAQRLQILLDRDVVEVALTGLAPDHQRHGSERLAMHQNFAPGNRRSVHDVRIAGRNPRDVGRIVDDDALSDRQANLFRAPLGEKPTGRAQS